MSSLEKPILAWFKKNKRDLPWRDTTPWGVMVSEYMLQQTPVNRVLPKWNEWMERWPTPKDLAKATPAQVIGKRISRFPLEKFPKFTWKGFPWTRFPWKRFPGKGFPEKGFL